MSSDATVLEYLDRVLRIDPATAAERIIDERARFLGADPADRGDATGDDVTEELSRLASELWTIEDEAFEARVAELAPRAAGGVATAWLCRLVSARAARGELARARTATGAFGRLVEDLLELAVSPPETVAQRRLEALEKIGSSHVAVARGLIDRLGVRYPKVAALDREYLERLRTLGGDRSRARKTYRSMSTTGESNSLIPLIWWIFLSCLVLKALGALLGVTR